MTLLDEIERKKEEKKPEISLLSVPEWFFFIVAVNVFKDT